ncbi:alpha/beta fold hydrolase [Brachybacterium hainanense]|uniref:Alpha/beta fold hydrolase n=1 Tax=Brachybacterium hainanense TaxID=1541174 RepID=A0ABV6RA48_9MICO
MTGPAGGLEEDPVSRDGRRLHSRLTGQGEAVVVLEAGLGATRDSWAGLVPLLEPHARVLVYDRAGLGRSEPAQDDRRLPSLVADLHAVTARVERPLVLVGHSWGGPIVRRFAEAHPRRVQGLVLVDPSDERCLAYFSRANALQTALAVPLMPLLARLGLIAAGVRPMTAGLPQEAAARLLDESSTVPAARAAAAEMAASGPDLVELRDHPPQLPDVPVTWISGVQASRLERGLRDSLVAAHEASARAHGRGRHVRAERSGHLVPMTEPELIAAEVRRILADEHEAAAPGRGPGTRDATSASPHLPPSPGSPRSAGTHLS